MFFVFFLIPILLASISLGANAEGQQQSSLYFLGNAIPDSYSHELVRKLPDILDNICSISQIENAVFEAGTPIAVLNSSAYLVPIRINGVCEYLLQMDCIDGEYLFCYGTDGAAEFDALKPGTYYCASENDTMYILGDNGVKLFLFGVGNADDIFYNTALIDKFSANLLTFDYLSHSTGSAKGILSKTLDVTNILYNGNYSYCWLSSAISMCRYYGSSVAVSTAHNYIHSSHTYPSCPGGSKLDTYNLISHYTGKSAVWAPSRCKAPSALASINLGIPVLAWLSRTDSSGNTIHHTIIIKGYTFNNTTGDFTYVICDPNYTSTKYQTSTYSATTMKYQQSATIQYTWTDALYDWN